MKKLVLISIATVTVLTFSGCGNNSNSDSAKDAATQTAKKMVEATKESATKATEATKEAANNMAQKAHEGMEKAKESMSKATEAVKEKAKDVANAAKQTANEIEEKAKNSVAGGDVAKGKAIFAKCASCHGADGKTKALGKSEIIAGQPAADLEKKIQEYKAGTRNVAGMGMLMKGQVSSLSDEDIKAVAAYISSLK